MYFLLLYWIVAVSSIKVFRRIKDVYDIAVLASLKDYSFKNILRHIEVKHGRPDYINMLTQENFDKLQHAYVKYDAVSHDKGMYELMCIDSTFLQPFYINYEGELIWNHLTSRWEQV